ncbi:MAG: hypothetical protein LBE12_04065 [Planctomycetaceae bacterium]|jgi:hypothetical protein|nr:hypothetical protein [Planctomycetaceae bacterium]
MNRFWQQNRLLISIIAVFLVLGIVPLAVMRFLPTKQLETTSPETESDNSAENETFTETTENVAQQRPFDRFLETLEEDVEEIKNKEVKDETVTQIVSSGSGQPLEPVLQPEADSEIPAKPDTTTITSPIVPTDIVVKKQDNNLELPTPQPVNKPEPVNPEPPKTELPKPEPSKPEPSMPEPSKPEPPMPEPSMPEPSKTEPNTPKTIKTKNSLDLIPFLYFYQQSHSGHQTIILFPITTEHTPLIFESNPKPVLVPVIPIIPVVPVFPVISVRPVYTPFVVPIIEYY